MKIICVKIIKNLFFLFHNKALSKVTSYYIFNKLCKSENIFQIYNKLSKEKINAFNVYCVENDLCADN